MMSALVSVDQSTQGTKGLVWDARGRLLGRCDVPHAQLIHGEGWVSHDLDEIWRNVRKAVKGALEKAKIDPGDVAALGISNQRETACCWSASTGKPLCNAVVWQCGRAYGICQELRGAGLEDEARRKTGLPISPYFSAPKFAWMLRNEPAVQAAARAREVRFGTVDSYLVWKMTRGQAYMTDCSNASRTGLMRLQDLAWDETLLRAYALEAWMLPAIAMSDADYMRTTLDGLFPRPVPIRAVMGDSHASLFAHGCHRPGRSKITYGTGSSIMMNAGDMCPPTASGAVTGIAWGMRGKAAYCLEGNVNNTGALVTWLIHDMELIKRPDECEPLAVSVPDNAGVYLVPAFSGLGAPYFEPRARAAIVGMDRACRKAHIVRAALEAICYQIADVVRAMERAAGQDFTGICVDGGPTRNRFLMEFQAGMLNRTLMVSKTEELSGAGAAYCAGIAAGLTDWQTLEQARLEYAVAPNMTAQRRQKNDQGWKRALETVVALPKKYPDRQEA